MSRLPLSEIRELVLDGLGEEWITPKAFMVKHLGWSSGKGWYVVALTLERLANDGMAEIKIRGNRRYFRRAGS